MNIICDFDWTLYDMATCKQAAIDRNVMEYWLQGQLWSYLDPKNFFYDDTLPWLEHHRHGGHTIHILTIHHGPDWGADAEAFQRIKLARCGVED